jgi:xylose isomerase
MTLQEQFERAAGVEGLGGVGLDYPYQFTRVDQVKPLLTGTGLSFVTLEIGLYPDRKWKNGAYTAPDPGIRREAIEMSKQALDVAAELGAEDVLMWPGQDGFDYPFQSDYLKYWGLMVEGIAEVAAHRPDVNIAIEYKPKEPRTNCYIRNAGVLLGLLSEVGLKNVGACIDLGHSLVAGENPGEAAVLLHRSGRLFQVHINDNFRDWDHDLIVGSVSFWETLEFFYWLRRCGWDGWYILDIYPYRIDGFEALQQGVQRTRFFAELASRVDTEDLRGALGRADVASAAKELWKTAFGA